jgi:hypothetical protein
VLQLGWEQAKPVRAPTHGDGLDGHGGTDAPPGGAFDPSLASASGLGNRLRHGHDAAFRASCRDPGARRIASRAKNRSCRFGRSGSSRGRVACSCSCSCSCPAPAPQIAAVAAPVAGNIAPGDDERPPPQLGGVRAVRMLDGESFE